MQWMCTPPSPLRAVQRYNSSMKFTRGFTLIELLVVIAIIAILSSVVLASLSGTQAKARDARRMEDISTLQKAISLYSINKGYYPIMTATTTLNAASLVTQALIAEQTLSAIPLDPQSPVSDYTYASNDRGNDYWIGFCLETDNIPNYSEGCNNFVSP